MSESLSEYLPPSTAFACKHSHLPAQVPSCVGISLAGGDSMECGGGRFRLVTGNQASAPLLPAHRDWPGSRVRPPRRRCRPMPAPHYPPPTESVTRPRPRPERSRPAGPGPSGDSNGSQRRRWRAPSGWPRLPGIATRRLRQREGRRDEGRMEGPGPRPGYYTDDAIRKSFQELLWKCKSTFNF